MAKYTELLSEYLASGGQLPTAFADIAGFEDAFKLRYYDCEIGFETEALFAMKLELIAEMYIPIYEGRLQALVTATGFMTDMTATRYEYVDVFDNIPLLRAVTTDLPFTSATAAPAQKVETDAHEDEHTQKREVIDIKDTLQIIDDLNKNITSIIDSLLNEFKTCFMCIY